MTREKVEQLILILVLVVSLILTYVYSPTRQEDPTPQFPQVVSNDAYCCIVITDCVYDKNINEYEFKYEITNHYSEPIQVSSDCMIMNNEYIVFSSLYSYVFTKTKHLNSFSISGEEFEAGEENQLLVKYFVSNSSFDIIDTNEFIINF